MLFVQTMDTGSVMKVVFITIFEIGMAFCDVATGLCSQLVLEKKAPHLVATSVSLIRCSMACGITVGTAFVLSLLQSQSITDVNAFQASQPDTYNELMRYDAAYNYDRVRYIPSTSLKHTLNIMYFENIRTITYGFLVAGVISLVSAIFIKVPSISKTSLEETSKE
jgi:hypothetical protein